MSAPSQTLPRHVSGPRAYGWWGMVWLIATEAMLFGVLIASYFYLRFRSAPEWPPDGIPAPELGLVAVMTAILWSSSIPVHIADRALRSGKRGLPRVMLAVAFLLGAAFLILQIVVEYPALLEDFTPRTNAYGSIFFAITGMHGIHVAVGLLFNLWVQGRAWAGGFDEERHVTVQNFTMYWHFVDVVWLFVLASLYLSPRL